MTFTTRPWQAETDLPLMADLLQSVSPTSTHLIDLPWRLSSPALYSGRDARVWMDERGRLLGFAVWQLNWAVLDFFVRPGSQQQEVETSLFNWTIEHFRELDRERGYPLPFWSEFREDDRERQRLIEAHGFLLADDHHYVQLEHPLGEPLPEPVLSAEFTMRPLAGIAEVQAYVDLHRAAFESTSMTYDWRLRTLHDPLYQPELDLVVVAPDASLAGFCVGWLDPLRQVGQVEPLGVHPRFHRLGLGRALLLELLRRFKSHHARRAIVEPMSSTPVAISTYEAVGFRPIHQNLRRGQFVTPFNQTAQ